MSVDGKYYRTSLEDCEVESLSKRGISNERKECRPRFNLDKYREENERGKRGIGGMSGWGVEAREMKQ